MKHLFPLNTLIKKLLFSLVLLVSVIGISFFAWIYFSTLQVEKIESTRFVNLPNAPMLESGQNLKILSWNIQFLAGNENNNFFFDGGEDSWPAMDIRQQVLEQIVAIIITENPDVILLQEVDDGAKRTGNQDQLAALMGLLPKEYGNHSSAFYWKADFVPHPALMGSAGMKLSTISKYQITQATRYALTSIQSQSWIMQQMNPKRAILEVQLPINHSSYLNLMNTHLSAFAQSDNTMEIQVNQVIDLMAKKQVEGNADVIIGGDFNLLSSSSAYNLLDTKGKSYYNPDGTELAPMFESFRSIPSLDVMNSNDYADWFTHSPNHISGALPDRTIDYLFYTDGLKLVEQKVLSRDTLLISDHLPVIGIFTIP